MTASEIPFLVLVLSAFTLFGGALGWASWAESRISHKSRK